MSNMRIRGKQKATNYSSSVPIHMPVENKTSRSWDEEEEVEVSSLAPHPGHLTLPHPGFVFKECGLFFTSRKHFLSFFYTLAIIKVVAQKGVTHYMCVNVCVVNQCTLLVHLSLAE